MIIMPGKSYKGALPPLSAEETVLRDRLRDHVSVLADQIGERNTFRYSGLRKAVDYLSSQFRDLGLPVRTDTYRIDGKNMMNLETELRGTTKAQEIVLVGAHYDSVANSPGANDNASGVAAVLEIARLLKDSHPQRTIRFVAFVNEEPPHFLTDSMGSLVYARRAKERKNKIVAMLSLETIGYYSDKPGSQQYPPPLDRFYPDTGNFIAFVGDLGSAALVRRAIGTFRETTKFPSEGAAAPGWVMGVGWSDHWAFWQAGYHAIMVTDTALFRYPHYHEPTDTAEKLDCDRMARVVSGVRHVVEDLASAEKSQ